MTNLNLPRGAWSALGLFLAFGLIAPVHAASGGALPVLHMTDHYLAICAVVVFLIAYALVVFEEQLHLKKSIPVLVGATIIWLLIDFMSLDNPEAARAHLAADGFEHVFAEFAQLFFFLLVAMTFVNAMTERNIFEALRVRLLRSGFGYQSLFWITGVISFFMSAVLDNLTTALIMSAVVLAVGASNTRFITMGFVNLVVAANAGGAWSAFGDITTLMAWNAGKVEFFEFFKIFVPSVVNWIIPAAIMAAFLPDGQPTGSSESIRIKRGGFIVCILFAVTIAFTVLEKNFFKMPAVYGMLGGLAMLKAYSHVLNRAERRRKDGDELDEFPVFDIIARAEWDTLLFFFGVLACVGGLATIGYMELLSTEMYGGLGHTWANVIMGTLSAIVDNIPIMYAVIQMNPPMDHGQWLLITLTCGVGGSMLSVGSAAGVALMGVSHGKYTFFGHLKWTWAVALGYIASVAVHLWLNESAFTNGIWA